jgi:acetoin utilization deacetylase AcuC-like enzyme
MPAHIDGMPIWYHPIYTEGIHPDARFPRERYVELIKRLKSLRNSNQFLFLEPNKASRSELVIGHDPYYVDNFLNGKLSDKEIKRIGLTPWTPKLIPRTLRLMGGAIAALNHVVENGGIAGNMAGGTHHAHYDFGSGYCIFNDLAVCALLALQKHNYERVAILDLDVHQGDGTATILQNIDGALTISLHCQENFPFRKAVSDHDLELEANSSDEQFLQKVNQAIDIAIKFNPQLILYQAGVDGLATDALGKLNITREGMSERNQLVFDMVVKHSIPTVVFMGGGYSKPISHTIDAFCDLFTAAAEANNRFTNTHSE